MAPARLKEKAFPPESTCATEGKTNPSRNLGNIAAGKAKKKRGQAPARERMGIS
jgi:hypothetical protein